VLEYLPLAQSVHEPGPTALLCFPAGQATQLPPSGPVYPAAHLQSAAASLPAGDSELDGQLIHEPLPLLLLYFPATQLTQAAPSAPVYPTSHLQSAKESLAACESEPAGQV